MKTTIDNNGRIQLPESIQKQLGLKPGDEVLLEEQNGQWLIKACRDHQGLGWEGNVLVHHGQSREAIEQTLADIREERLSQMSKGLPR